MANTRSANGALWAIALAVLVASCDRRSEPIAAVPQERAHAAKSAAAAAPEPARDPAQIDGTWNYRTESNCGTVPGVGEVSFVWNAATSVYDETGSVYWADSKNTIKWWGIARHEPEKRKLVAHVSNSLGDTVDGDWDIEGTGPDRLVVRWTQTNGCRGVGTATRAVAKKVAG